MLTLEPGQRCLYNRRKVCGSFAWKHVSQAPRTQRWRVLRALVPAYWPVAEAPAA
jgi:hypothetical protein